ncbi:MAG: DUF1003 domain-containing protein [Gemmatimonadota bacterium]
MNGRTRQERADDLAPVMDRNIRTLIQRRIAEERSAGMGDRVAGLIARFVGSFAFVTMQLLIIALWFAINFGWIRIIPPFDSSFAILTMGATVEALFLSAFILIRQNRMAAISEKRADLNLQMSLLAEHEITQVIKLVTLIAERLNIAEASDPELGRLAQDVAPGQVLDKMQAHEEAETRDSTL